MSKWLTRLSTFSTVVERVLYNLCFELELFQVDVLGTCTTEITESHAEEEIEILKRRETEKCEGRPKHTIMVQSQVGA